jgi:hypothetical protein
MLGDSDTYIKHDLCKENSVLFLSFEYWKTPNILLSCSLCMSGGLPYVICIYETSVFLIYDVDFNIGILELKGVLRCELFLCSILHSLKSTFCQFNSLQVKE